MNSDHDTSHGNTRAWIAPEAGNPSSPFPTNWQTFGSFNWTPEPAYVDAVISGIASFPAVGVVQGHQHQHQHGHHRETIRELNPPTQPIRPESMAPPPSQTSTRHQAPKTGPDNAAPLKGRKRQPPESTWNKHKGKIKDLYMTQDISLENTMKVMEKEHGFCPSSKMYKQKFKTWKWSKKLPKDKAQWMLGRANERRDAILTEPKDTIFEWGHQLWTADTIRESMGRRNGAEGLASQDGPTPSDVVVKTPVCIVESLQHLASPACSRIPGGPWTPTALPSTLEPRKVSSLRLRWHDLTLTDVQNLMREAARLDKAGDTINAEKNFRDALSGFETMLSPTHEETTIAAYQLASFFANQDRMKEADKVLDWLGGKYIQRWGLNHGKSIGHLLRVIELLQSWGRRDDVLLLLTRVLDIWDDLDSDIGPNIVSLSTNYMQDTEVDGIDPNVADQIFEESSNEIQVESQLRVVSLWLSSKADGLEPILVRLIQQCEKYPEKLKAQTLQARCSLARLYLRLEQRDLATGVLQMAYKSLMEILALDEDLHVSILKASRQLAFSYVECNDIKGCDDVLERVAELLEARLGERNGQIEVVVGFLTDIAREYQRVLAWQNAAPWFERALAISLIGLGSEDENTKRLEAALQNQQYNVTSNSYDDFEDLIRSGAQNFTVRIRH